MSQAAGAEARPDIVMVLSDQHAARALGCAGDAVAETPALDRLAGRGVRFANCYCPSPLCAPSRMAFLTGRLPSDIGVFTNNDMLASGVPTLAHALGAAGYDCRLVGRMHFYGPDQTHGFGAREVGDIGANWPGGRPPDIGPLTRSRGNRGPELEGSGAGETSYQAFDQAVTQAALATLEELAEQRRRTGRPFFLLVGLFNPHPPFIAPRAAFDRFAGRVPPPRLPRPEADHPAIAAWRAAGAVTELSETAIARSRAAYYALVSQVDALAGQLFDAVDAAKLELPVKIYASDHGEMLGERGLWWKSVFFDQSATVPLIVSAPGRAAAGAVRREVVSLLDLGATLLDWGGAPALPRQAGASLGPLALGDASDWRNRAVSEYFGGLMNIQTGPERRRMLRRDRWKLCLYEAHPPQLFDLQEDPDELRDRADDPAAAAVLADLTADALIGWDPRAVAAAQAEAAERADLIRAWVRATDPPETARWADPRPQRNRRQ